jgi:hypothetical protein
VQGDISVNGSLSALSIPALETTTAIYVTSSGLSELTLPGSLLAIHDLQLEQNAELTSLVLTAVGEATFLTVRDSPKLTHLEAGDLTTINVSLALDNTGLTNLYSLDPDTLPLHGNLTIAGAVGISNNAALPSCLVDLFGAHLQARGPVMFSNMSNLDAPGACP